LLILYYIKRNEWKDAHVALKGLGNRRRL